MLNKDKDKKNTMINKKVGIADLIKNADKIKESKKATRELYVKSLEGTITIQKPDRDLILESYDMEEKDGNLYLVYEAVIEPNFKADELHKAYGTKGYEILDKVMDPGEVDAISKEIVKFAGYGDNSVSLVEDIKNE
jgi:predicted S18 family serine protease